LTDDDMRRRFDLTPLGHPVWWGALALLLVNDDLLKGRGVVPGWLTGKLSDVAFLIVAPVVFAALIPRRAPGRRTFAVTSVVALFVAADLSRAVSDAVVALAAGVGLTWRLWPDPTDLVAVAVLPITIWLLRRPPRPADTSPAARGGRIQRERAGIVLGALACIATSAPPTYGHNPFLHNRTAGAASVRITWVLRQIDCETTPEALAPTLGPSDLDDPLAAVLQSGQVVALDGPPPKDVSPVGVCATNQQHPTRNDDGCVAAILEADGAEAVLMVAPSGWEMDADSSFICPGPPPVSRCAPNIHPSRNPGPDAVSITNTDGVLRFALAGSGPGEQLPPRGRIRIAPIDPAVVAMRPPAATGCRALRDTYHAFAQMTACTADSDCQALPGLALPGETFVCDIYVNRSVSAAAYTTLANQWEATCLGGEGSCPPAKPAACSAGTCRPSNQPTVGPPDGFPDAAGDAPADTGADTGDDTGTDAGGDAPGP
jgi:hypothetical protein